MTTCQRHRSNMTKRLSFLRLPTTEHRITHGASLGLEFIGVHDLVSIWKKNSSLANHLASQGRAIAPWTYLHRHIDPFLGKERHFSITGCADVKNGCLNSSATTPQRVYNQHLLQGFGKVHQPGALSGSRGLCSTKMLWIMSSLHYL